MGLTTDQNGYGSISHTAEVLQILIVVGITCAMVAILVLVAILVYKFYRLSKSIKDLRRQRER